MPSRQQVLWIGDEPDAAIEEAFSRRRLTLTRSSQLSNDQLSLSAAAIFNIGRYSGVIAGQVTSGVPQCLSLGARPIIRCDLETIKKVQTRLAEYEGRYSRILSTFGPDDLAEESRAGIEVDGDGFNNSLSVTGADLEGEDLILLQRAFYDCDEIELFPQREGKSNASVFRAHARIERIAPRAFMLPFLVKFDSAVNVMEELENFRSYVAPHVPFSHRPDIDSGRSLIGATRGILVGDFVEDATSLARICSDPRARGAIYSLFDDALRSWRRHAYAEPSSVRQPFTEGWSDLIRENEILQEVEDLARSYGLTASPSELVGRLTRASVFHYKRGIIHGDLHPGNVMVRGAEPILIDFASIRGSAPLVADVACMEVAVCFTVAPQNTANGRLDVHAEAFDAWRTEIDALFSETCLEYVPPLQAPPSDFNWLWSICRQTRVMAHLVGADRGPYKAALVAYLLRRARLGGNPTENLRIAAYALRTAQSVLECLESHATP